MFNKIARTSFAIVAVFSALAIVATGYISAEDNLYAPPANPALPKTTLVLDPARTAVVITDPQNDFLHPEGVAWGAVGRSVEANGTVKNLERLMKAAKDASIPLAISPHYYYEHDHNWKMEGPLEILMHNINMFQRKGQLTVEGFEGSGADWLAPYKKYINDGKTIVSNPHKVYGPESNDLSLQLRKIGVDTVILAGMSANLCTQAHMHELLEQGFEVIVVKDATAAAQLPEGDGYLAALINFRFMANGLWTTDEAVENIANLKK